MDLYPVEMFEDVFILIGVQLSLLGTFNLPLETEEEKKSG